jgi:hypothetical protein
MSKKQTRRAARQAFPKAPVSAKPANRVRNYGQKSTRPARPSRSTRPTRTAPALRPPTLKRAAIQGVILAVLYLLVIRFIWKQPGTTTLTYILMPVAGFLIYTAVAYGIDKFTYERRLRRLKGNSK